MPRWAWVTVIGVPLFIVSCFSIGYLAVVPAIRNFVANGQSDVSDQMTETVARSVAANITSPVYWPHRIVIPEQKFNVNNATAGGEVGFETGTNGTLIYGFVTEIDRQGISLFAGDTVAYSGTPVVQNGLVELTNAQASSSIFKFFLTSEGFEQAIEDGINRALAERGIEPISLTLGDGVLTIVVEPAASPT